MVNNEAVGTRYRKVKKIKEFRSLLLALLSLQNCRSEDLVWKEFKARNGLENHLRRVSSALYGEAKKSERLTWSGRMCLFVEGDQHHIKNLPQMWA